MVRARQGPAADAADPATPLRPGGKIRVPGIWDHQGYGTQTDKVHHNFVGKGWYQRQVDIPRTGPAGGVSAGHHGRTPLRQGLDRPSLRRRADRLLVAVEYDVTDYLSPGRTVTITIQVDSKQRWEVDTLFGTLDLADYMDVAWGGIWGHVYLERGRKLR